MKLPFSFPCPKCGVKLKIKDERLFGRSMKCPKCGAGFTTPASPEAVDKIEDAAVAQPAKPPDRPQPAPALITDEERPSTDEEWPATDEEWTTAEESARLADEGIPAFDDASPPEEESWDNAAPLPALPAKKKKKTTKTESQKSRPVARPSRRVWLVLAGLLACSIAATLLLGLLSLQGGRPSAVAPPTVAGLYVHPDKPNQRILLAENGEFSYTEKPGVLEQIVTRASAKGIQFGVNTAVLNDLVSGSYSVDGKDIVVRYNDPNAKFAVPTLALDGDKLTAPGFGTFVKRPDLLEQLEYARDQFMGGTTGKPAKQVAQDGPPKVQLVEDSTAVTKAGLKRVRVTFPVVNLTWTETPAFATTKPSFELFRSLYSEAGNVSVGMALTSGGLGAVAFRLTGALPAASQFSPSAAPSSAGGPRWEIRLFHYIDGKHWRTLNTDNAEDTDLPLHRLIFAGDGHYVVGAGHSTIAVWNLADGKRTSVTTVGGEDDPTSFHELAVRSDGRKVAVAGPGKAVQMLDPESGKLTKLLEFPDMPKSVEYVAFSPDGNTIAAGGGADVILADASTGKVKKWFQISSIAALRLSPDQQKWIDGDVVRLLETDLLRALAFSPDGKRLAVGQAHIYIAEGTTLSACTAAVWDLETNAGQSVRLPSARDSQGTIPIAWSPTGQALACARGGVCLWQLDETAETAGKDAAPIQFGARKDEALCLRFGGTGSLPEGAGPLAFAADGATLVSCGPTGRIEIWKLGAGAAPPPPPTTQLGELIKPGLELLRAERELKEVGYKLQDGQRALDWLDKNSSILGDQARREQRKQDLEAQQKDLRERLEQDRTLLRLMPKLIEVANHRIGNSKFALSPEQIGAKVKELDARRRKLQEQRLRGTLKPQELEELLFFTRAVAILQERGYPDAILQDLVNQQGVLRGSPETISKMMASNAVEIDLLSLNGPEAVEAKRKELEARRDELGRQHDAATARAQRLRTTTQHGNPQAMAAALEPFFKKGDGPASRGDVEWQLVETHPNPRGPGLPPGGQGVVHWHSGETIVISLHDPAEDAATTPKGQASEPNAPAADGASPKVRHGHWCVEGDDVVLYCGYFRLDFGFMRYNGIADRDFVINKEIKAQRDFSERDRSIDLDGLAAVKPR